jgi:hypothetical protein
LEPVGARPPARTAAGGLVSFGPVADPEAVGISRRHVPEARAYVNPYPPAALSRAESVYAEAVLPGMESGVVALLEVSSSRLPRAVVPGVPVVRRSLPRLEVQPCRREEGRARTPGHGPLPGRGVGRDRW